MLPIFVLTLLTFFTSASPTVSHVASYNVETPVIWVAGDSTTAPDGGHNGTEGWGQYLQYSFGDNARVNNSAYAGRSARSVCLDSYLSTQMQPRPQLWLGFHDAANMLGMRWNVAQLGTQKIRDD